MIYFYLCSFAKNLEFFRTYPTFFSIPLLMLYRAHQKLNTLFWGHPVYVYPLTYPFTAFTIQSSSVSPVSNDTVTNILNLVTNFQSLNGIISPTHTQLYR